MTNKNLYSKKTKVAIAEIAVLGCLFLVFVLVVLVPNIADAADLSAYCSASSAAVLTNQTVTFASVATGGNGSYIYSWAGDCSGSSSTCVKSFSNPGVYTAQLTVNSGSQSRSASCPVNVVGSASSNLSVSCYASPSSINTNQSTTFISSVSGGSGSYNYSWSGECSGSSSTCNQSFSASGTHTSYLTVTSGSQSGSANCSVNVTNSTASNLSVSCYASPSTINVNQNAVFISSVSGGTGSYNYLWSGACSGSSSTCNQYFYNSGSYTASLTVTSGSQVISASCPVNVNQYNNNNNTHSYTQCYNNSVYWFDNYGYRNDLYQACGYNQTCQNGYCQTNYQPIYTNNHSYTGCYGNNIYWFSNYGSRTDLYQACLYNQTCQNGYCVNNNIYPTYFVHNSKACYGGNLYWYDSLGVRQGAYSDCNDRNSCTIDSCSVNKCVNILKCDGSTCAVGSDDYNSLCGASNIVGLAATIFGKNEESSVQQWLKTFSASSDQEIDFTLVVSNGQDSQLDNVNAKVNFPTEIIYDNNLSLDGASYSGDITAGINLGTLPAKAVKIIAFKGKVASSDNISNGEVIVTAAVTTSSGSSSDSAKINLTKSAPVSSVSSGFLASLLGINLNRPIYILLIIIVIILILIGISRIVRNLKERGEE